MTDFKDFTPDRDKFRDEMGRFRTQSLFIEHGYREDTAIYSLQEYHREYKGVAYPSLKQLYLEMADPTEYEFANKYFYSWEHWQRVRENKALDRHIAGWTEELELKLRAAALKNVLSLTGGNFNASRWVADGSWRAKKAGRPKKAETEREREIRKKVVDETAGEAGRILEFVKKEAK